MVLPWEALIELSLKGKTALICGASKGIGLAAAKVFSRLGAKPILLARCEAALKAAAADLPGARLVVQDLAQTQALKDQIQRVLQEVGAIEILINNTGGPRAGALNEAPTEELVSSFNAHVISAHTIMQLLLPGMKRAKYGRILNVLSTSVKTPLPNLGVSNTVRGAMANWSKTLASELGPFGITVNNVLPGFTATDRLQALKEAQAGRESRSPSEIEAQWLKSIPAGRFADPEELGNALAFLASPAGGYINGINLPVDGGRTLSL